MAVEENRFNLREHAVVAVEVRPAGLDHADAGFGEVVHDLHEPICRGDEIGVEDGDEVAFCDFQARIEGTCLESVAVGAVHIDDGVAKSGVSGYNIGGDLLGLVGGIIEKLDFELVGGVLHGADGFNQAVDDELLVVNGQLDRDPGQFVELSRGTGVVVLLVLVVEVHHRIAVDAVDSQDDHNREIRDEKGGVEDIPDVASFEYLIGVLLGSEKVAQAALGRKHGQLERQGQPT